MKWKRCTTCGKHKPAHAFYRNVDARDGLRTQCKDCRAKADEAYHRQQRQERKVPA